MIRTTMIAALAGIAALAAPAAAHAHHSFALFDTAKDVTLTGVVKEFQWTNPHVFVQVVAADGKEWSIEASATNSLRRNGWTRNSFKPGEKVSILMHPLKDGKPGGAFMNATFADGRKLSEAGDLAANSLRTKTQD